MSTRKYSDSLSISVSKHNKFSSMLLSVLGVRAADNEHNFIDENNEYGINFLAFRRSNGKKVYINESFRDYDSASGRVSGRPYNDIPIRCYREDSMSDNQKHSTMFKMLDNGIPKAVSENADFWLVYAVTDKSGDKISRYAVLNLILLGSYINQGKIIFDPCVGRSNRKGDHFDVEGNYHPLMKRNIDAENGNLRTRSTFACFNIQSLMRLDERLVYRCAGFVETPRRIASPFHMDKVNDLYREMFACGAIQTPMTISSTAIPERAMDTLKNGKIAVREQISTSEELGVSMNITFGSVIPL